MGVIFFLSLSQIKERNLYGVQVPASTTQDIIKYKESCSKANCLVAENFSHSLSEARVARPHLSGIVNAHT